MARFFLVTFFALASLVLAQVGQDVQVDLSNSACPAVDNMNSCLKAFYTEMAACSSLNVARDQLPYFQCLCDLTKQSFNCINCNGCAYFPQVESATNMLKSILYNRCSSAKALGAPGTEAPTACPANTDPKTGKTLPQSSEGNPQSKAAANGGDVNSNNDKKKNGVQQGQALSWTLVVAAPVVLLTLLML
jgi:hypothetical protein